MDNVVFSATTRNGKYYFEVEDDGGKVDRYTIRQDGSTNYADTPNQILGELVMQTEWKEGTFEKILVDELGIGKEYLQIVKMIRAKYNWLENYQKVQKVVFSILKLEDILEMDYIKMFHLIKFLK